MKITVYIPCHNNESTVGEAAAGLRNQTRLADQFLFINDRCSDRSPESARGHGFEVIDLIGRKGLAAGRNLALQHCTGDVLAGFDADVFAEPDYLEQLEKCFQRNPHVVGVGGRMDEKHTQAPPDLWRATFMPQHHGDKEVLNPRLLFGSTMACRVEALRRVGGWNEQFVLSFEDYDLSMRLKNSGLNYIYSPTCRAWHLRRDTVDTILRTHWNWNYFGYERDLASLDQWLNHRLPTIWATYRNFRLQELSNPILAPITMRLPWGWMIRDLFALRKSIGYFGDIPPIVSLAADLFRKYGADEQIQSDIRQWLTQLIDSLEDTPARGPLHPNILNSIARMAYESVPNAAYWRNCSTAAK